MRPESTSKLTVPVIVDDIKTFGDFPMARCSHFVVDGDRSANAGELTFQTNNSILLVTGVRGVICGRGAKNLRFEDGHQIDELFDSFEADDQFSIETADIWIPNSLIVGSHEGAKRGDVFRIGANLFKVCFDFRYERLDQSDFLMLTGDLAGSIEYSATETGAFAHWHEIQLGQCVENCERQRSAGIALGWKE
jgi:hypothetical protein